MRAVALEGCLQDGQPRVRLHHGSHALDCPQRHLAVGVQAQHQRECACVGVQERHDVAGLEAGVGCAPAVQHVRSATGPQAFGRCRLLGRHGIGRGVREHAQDVTRGPASLPDFGGEAGETAEDGRHVLVTHADCDCGAQAGGLARLRKGELRQHGLHRVGCAQAYGEADQSGCRRQCEPRRVQYEAGEDGGAEDGPAIGGDCAGAKPDQRGRDCQDQRQEQHAAQAHWLCC